MKICPLTWEKLIIEPTDSKELITRKLEECGVVLGNFHNSTYVIRISNTFIVEYKNQKCSPVIYIGEGHIRARLYRHLGWLTKLAESLPGAKIEAKFCFPKTESGEIAHMQFESYLLSQFVKRYGSFPLKNRIHGIKKESVNFSEEKTAQIIGHGKGNKYIWSIRPRISKSVYYQAKAH